MSVIKQERWAFSSALHVENPTVGKFTVTGLKTGIELSQHNQHNWLVCSVPGPNILEAWRIKAVLILYNIKGSPGGKIDKIGIRNGHLDVYGFENLTIGPNANWELKRLELPGTGYTFRYSLGVTIHVMYQKPEFEPTAPPTQFFFTGVGLEFIK
jgi:hypothetical protein